jgi:hypothetical protein
VGRYDDLGALGQARLLGYVSGDLTDDRVI